MQGQTLSKYNLAWMTVLFTISSIVGKSYGCTMAHKQIDLVVEVELKTSPVYCFLQRNTLLFDDLLQGLII